MTTRQTLGLLTICTPIVTVLLFGVVPNQSTHYLTIGVVLTLVFLILFIVVDILGDKR